MKTKNIALYFLLIFFSLSSTAWAVNYLQLDIEGGTYVGGEDSTVYAQTGVFTLYGLVDSNKGTLDDVFYISAALVSDLLEPVNTAGDYGSFLFNGIEFDVTGDMTYGTPPIEAAESSNLPSHGLFPTYFKEFSFTEFDGRANEYDVELNWGGTAGGLTPNPDGPLYYTMFSVNTNSIAEGYAIHFDLYTKTAEGDLNKFAPFSHDAQSGPSVPEPATMLLFGTGLAGLATRMRKKIS